MPFTPSILIIDDGDEFRTLMREWLEEAGYNILEAPDGEKGLQLYRANPVPLAIVDIIMPQKEGIETIFELRNDFPDVKIIAISGGGQLGPDSYLNLALAAGADRSLRKPFDGKTLLAAVNMLNLTPAKDMIHPPCSPEARPRC